MNKSEIRLDSCEHFNWVEAYLDGWSSEIENIDHVIYNFQLLSDEDIKVMVIESKWTKKIVVDLLGQPT